MATHSKRPAKGIQNTGEMICVPSCPANAVSGNAITISSMASSNETNFFKIISSFVFTFIHSFFALLNCSTF
jgi:hypothetical protein